MSDSRRYEVIELSSLAGSLEHFFHFFYGGLVPLVLDLASGPQRDLCFVRSCGPMNRLLHELRLENIVLVEKDSLAQLARKIPSRSLQPLDRPDRYNKELFQRARDLITKHLGISGASQKGSDVVFIQRGESDPFYLSSVSERPQSANLRRSIPNMDELFAAARVRYPDARLAELEQASLADQVRMFSNARVLVAQHGAALSNLLWMPPDATVIEIITDRVREFDWFGDLARTFGLKHRAVTQKSAHAPVDVEAVLAAMEA